MKSVFDDYLPVEARSGYQKLSPADFTDAVRLVTAAMKIKRTRDGARTREMKRIAGDFGVSRRTLYRWAEDDTAVVHLNGWHATFRFRDDGPPRQATTWVKS